jgi:PTH1 family peptidyl-tRNA hydrolase
MRLVVGLGSPGEEYAHTLHNLGFLVVDRLAEQNSSASTAGIRGRWWGGKIGGQTVMLAKPQTFMNLSGTAVAPLMEKHELKPEDLVLVYDELDLPWTGLRIKPKGSSANHNGVESVIRSLGTKGFARVRLGIHPGHPIRDGADFVLSSFKRQQEKELDELLGHAAEAVSSIIAEGVVKTLDEI